MKICPVCQTRFKETTLKCRYCNEMLITVSPPGKKTSVKHYKKKKRGIFSFDWRIKFKKIWNKYWYWVYVLIISIIVPVVGFQYLSQNMDVSKNLEQFTKIKSPNLEESSVTPGLESSQNSSDSKSTPDDFRTAEDWNNMAVTSWANGKYADPKKAIEYLNKAIKLQPNYIKTYYNRGLAYYNLGQYQQAIDDYNEAIRLKPDYTNAYYNRGAVYLNLGNKNLACSDLGKACELGECDQLEKAKKNKICR